MGATWRAFVAGKLAKKLTMNDSVMLSLNLTSHRNCYKISGTDKWY